MLRDVIIRSDLITCVVLINVVKFVTILHHTPLCRLRCLVAVDETINVGVGSSPITTGMGLRDAGWYKLRK